MKHLTIVLLAIVVVGCSPSTTRWTKAGATTEDLHLDQDECASRRSGYDFAFLDRDTSRPGIVESGVDSPERRAGSPRAEVYRECMENRGWRRERGGQAPQ
jgi:hypothetical protein